MSSTVHPQQEKLLELAYGELAGSDAKRLELHLQACPRCAEALSSIRRVRQTMSQLPTLEAPERGMDSLLAYAEQAARRARSGPASAPSWWSRLIVPAATAVALVAVVAVGIRVTQRVNLSPEVVEVPRVARVSSRPEMQVKAVEEPERKAEEVTSEAKQARADELGSRARGAGYGAASQADREIRTEPPAVKKHFVAKAPSPEPIDQQNSFATEARSPPAASPRELDSEQSPAKLASRPARVAVDDKLSERIMKRDSATKERRARSGADQARDGVEGGVVGGSLGAPPIVQRAAPTPTQQEKISASREAVQAMARGQNKGIAELSDDAAKAKDAGDRRREVAQLRQALAAGAEGQQRAELLNRLCDALYALGEPAEAGSTCDQVMREFPNSNQAATAMRRKIQEEVSRDKAKAVSSPPADALKAKQQPGN